jgi:hypothetical protein
VIVFAGFIGHDKHVAVAGKIVIDCVPVIIALLFGAFARDAVQKLASETDTNKSVLQGRDRYNNVVVER